jgi:bacterial/archaeal transporter family-2 protein
MSNLYFYVLLALAAGAMMPTQAAINNRLAGYVGTPIVAAFISFMVGTLGLFLYLVITGTPLSNVLSVKNAPAIAWIGGLLGAFFVASSIVLVPRLGVAMTFSLLIAGQMLVTLVIDHFGILDVPMKPVNFARIAGVLLIVGGVILIRRY